MRHRTVQVAHLADMTCNIIPQSANFGVIADQKHTRPTVTRKGPNQGRAIPDSARRAPSKDFKYNGHKSRPHNLELPPTHLHPARQVPSRRPCIHHNALLGKRGKQRERFKYPIHAHNRKSGVAKRITFGGKGTQSPVRANTCKYVSLVLAINCSLMRNGRRGETEQQATTKSTCSDKPTRRASQTTREVCDQGPPRHQTWAPRDCQRNVLGT